jgi:hypothetical protein
MVLNLGSKVRVQTALGVRERVVCGFSDGKPLFCTVDEAELARRDDREPRGIGWPREYVLEGIEEPG